MFGNADWFKMNSGKMPVPQSIWGWLFYAGWTAAVLGPVGAMLVKGQFPQAGIWLVVSLGACWFDISSVSRQIRKRREWDRLFFIGDEDNLVSTNHYELQLKSRSESSVSKTG